MRSARARRINFVQCTIYMIFVANGLFKANRLMPCALALTPALRMLRQGNGSLLMCSGPTISSIGHRDISVATVAAPGRNFGEVHMLPAILCSSTVHLCDPVATTWKFCAVRGCVRRIGASTLDLALSIRRAIRGNFETVWGFSQASDRPHCRSCIVQQSGSRTNRSRTNQCG